MRLEPMLITHFKWIIPVKTLSSNKVTLWGMGMGGLGLQHMHFWRTQWNRWYSNTLCRFWYTHRIYHYKTIIIWSECHCHHSESSWTSFPNVFSSPSLEMRESEFINSYPALCQSCAVILSPSWEIELDGQLASERAWGEHNPPYVTHAAHKVCTAVLERGWGVWKSNLCRSGKFIHPLHYFCCLYFYFAFSRGTHPC